MSDSPRTCVVVPTYDNPRTVRRVIEAIREYIVDIILVDDGSGAEGRAACEKLESDGLVILRRLDVNRGKGAAVKAGLSKARDLGYSHAFQVDADGQHDIDCMPAFLGASATKRNALVLGYPVYDMSVPRSRFIARKFTSFWVGLEVGQRDRIVDAMVGFRIYPVEPTLAVGARGDRMDFDIEIAVLMARAGFPIINLPVGISYPNRGDGGVSHFQPLRDNVRFCLLHCRLCMVGLFGWGWRYITGTRP